MSDKDSIVGSSLIERALSVLDYIAHSPGSVSILDISTALGIPTATVHRILQTLKETHYVCQLDNKQYGITYKLLESASNITLNDPLVNAVYPFMCYYAVRKGCQVGLSVFFGSSSILHLAVVGSAGRFNDRFGLPGTVLPAYCTAAGKVFLSLMSDEELDAWLEANSLIPRTSHTIICPDELRRQIGETRVRGYGIVISELYEDIACLSVPISNSQNTVIGTLNFSICPERFETLNTPEFVDDVRSKLKKINF